MKAWNIALISILALVLGMAVVISCGDDDDESDVAGLEADDDTEGDDDTGDDDSGDECENPAAFEWLYDNCIEYLTDEDGNPMTLAEAIEECNSCVLDCYDSYEECEDMITCMCQICFDNCE